jgi:hypothetical protein
MLLFCFRFSSHLIKKPPFCCMAFHKYFVSSIVLVEMISRVREIVPIQIRLSLSDEISYQDFCFWVSLVISSSDSSFSFSQTSARTKKCSKKRLNARANERHDPVLVQVDGHLPRGLRQSVALLEDSGSHQVSIQ